MAGVPSLFGPGLGFGAQGHRLLGGGPLPQAMVVERVTEPQGIVVVYRASQAEAVFRYHDLDLRCRGWVRVKYEVKKGEWKAEYCKGKAKAKLSVKDKKDRVEVRLKEGD